jgi:hypothetical protein
VIPFAPSAPTTTSASMRSPSSVTAPAGIDGRDLGAVAKLGAAAAACSARKASSRRR